MGETPPHIFNSTISYKMGETPPHIFNSTIVNWTGLCRQTITEYNLCDDEIRRKEEYAKSITE
jgi:hypothetical protein